jgi:FkbM family methyltransferase
VPSKSPIEKYWRYSKKVLRYRTFSRTKQKQKYRRQLDNYFDRPISSVVTKKGFTLFLNPKDYTISASIAVNRDYSILQEADVTRLVERIIGRDSTVVDVGANIGWYTMLAARRARKVYAFEPEPESFSLLSRAVTANNCENVEAYPLCLSDHIGTETLYLSQTRNKGNHSIMSSDGASAVQVDCTTLDMLFPEEQIDLLKLDAEGAECKVLSGAKNLIAQKRLKNVIMEWNPAFWSDMGILNQFTAFEINSRIQFKFEKDSVDRNVHLVPNQ